MKKRKIAQILFAIFLGAAVLGGIANVAAVNAATLPKEEEIRKEGTCGTNAKWVLSKDGTLTIYGSGDMEDYDIEKTDTFIYSPWHSYNESIKKVVIDEGITSIGVSAFQGCTQLTSVTLPESLTEIDKSAFSECMALPEVVIPTKVTSIKSNAFSVCLNLKKITLPESLKTIGEYAFSNTDVQELVLPESVTDIGKMAFYCCHNLKTINLPKNLTEIKYGTFYSAGLTGTIEIPEKIKVISDSAFKYCDMEYVVLPEGLKRIEQEAFDSCYSLKELVLPEKLEYIGAGAFCSCDSLKKITLLSDVEMTQYTTFSTNGALEEIVFGEKVTKIPYNFVAGETGLKSITIPENVKVIGERAFFYCSGLTELNIPENVTIIEKNAFNGCTGLKRIELKDTVKKIEQGAFGYHSKEFSILCNPQSEAHRYAVSENINFELIGTEKVSDVFSDMQNAWYTLYVQYAFDHGLMKGIEGTTEFQPNGNVTKAQLAQVLYNMEAQPEVTDYSACTELSDVYEDWFTDAVCWAYNNKIITGDLNTKEFKPSANVTREQFALMLYRYAQYKGYSTTQSSNLAGLKNAGQVSDWAAEGVKWSVGAGLISGIDIKGVKDLAPQGTASRGQMATILMRFCETYQK